MWPVRTNHDQHPAAAATARRARGPKNPTATWVLWMLLGPIGVHRYYLGDWKMGLCMTLTLGGLAFWSLIDGLFLNRRLRRLNAARCAV